MSRRLHQAFYWGPGLLAGRPATAISIWSSDIVEEGKWQTLRNYIWADNECELVAVRSQELCLMHLAVRPNHMQSEGHEAPFPSKYY